METAVRDKRLVIALRPGAEIPRRLRRSLVDDSCLVLDIRKVSPKKLEKMISRQRSKREVEAHRAELEATGQGDLFRAQDCPHCGATLDLSGLDITQYVHCRFCESVFDKSGQEVSDGDRFSTCDDCGLYDRVRGYTEGYFYFLLVIWGYRTQRKFVCDSCAGRIFWKTLLLNLPFLLGVPNAIAIMLKSLSDRSPITRHLAEANASARKGRPQEVAAAYQNLYVRVPDHPGLLMNEAIAHANAGDGNGCADRLQRTLGACANYAPALRLAMTASEGAD